MEESDKLVLEALGGWLASMADDVEALTEFVAAEGNPLEAKRPIVGALNYLLKSVDLIEDGIASIGYADDAMILRVAAAAAPTPRPELLERYAEDAAVVEEILGDVYPRFEKYVHGLKQASARGRSVVSILAEEEPRAALVADLRSFRANFEPPVFHIDERNLIKLRSFLNTKLPK